MFICLISVLCVQRFGTRMTLIKRIFAEKTRTRMTLIEQTCLPARQVYADIYFICVICVQILER